LPTTDVHNHVLPTEVIDLLNAEPAYGVSITEGEWRGVHHVPFKVVPEFYDADTKLSRLDDLGIDVAIISPPPVLFFYEKDADTAAEFCAVNNEGSAKFAARNPDRLRWLANLPMQNPDRAVDAYRSAVAAGCRGAALGTSIAGVRLDEPQFERFWAVAAEVGLPVLFHPAFNEPHAALASWYLQNVIGNLLETTVAVERLICAGVLTRHPDLRLVLLHGGGMLPYQMGRLRHAHTVRPELADAPIDLAAVLPRLYFDTITHDRLALQFLAQQVGERNVVLGTDMPFDMAPADPMGELRAAFAPDTLRRVSEENPQRLYGGTTTSLGSIPS
jgi:Predicted metal-dependent hydrolase of the TIM-barrel fold